MPLTTPNEYSPKDQALMLEIAKESIHYGLKHGEPLPLNLDDYPTHLQEQRATFVTLQIHHQLRGCIGTLEAHRPLIWDIAHNAHAAAFADPRFMPVTQDEAKQLELHISILNPSEEMQFDSEEGLIAQIRPEIDGLILSEGHLRGTFLPSVWESLKTPQEFVHHLKLKAGLPGDYWSNTIKVERYTTFSFP